MQPIIILLANNAACHRTCSSFACNQGNRREWQETLAQIMTGILKGLHYDSQFGIIIGCSSFDSLAFKYCDTGIQMSKMFV